MRPYLELLIGKNASTNSKNIRKSHIFGGSGGSILDTRLVNFRFEESDGDDIDKNRKGRKDIVSFTFIDQVPELQGFLSDSKEIEVDDLLYIRYGWIIGDKGQKVQPDLVEREFRIVKIEPKFNSSMSTLTVTAYDRSADLDRFITSILLDTKLSDGRGAGAAEKTPFKAALMEIARIGGLELDESGRVIFEDAQGNTIVELGGNLAIPRESLASYLKYLAEETGSVFYVENRRLFFGARKMPSRDKIAATILRGSDKTVFDVKSKEDLRVVPLLDMSIQRKLAVEGVAYKVPTQDKRTGVVDVSQVLASELSQILLISLDIDSGQPTVPFRPAPLSTEYSKQLNIPIGKAEEVLNDAIISERVETFFSKPSFFTQQEVSTILQQPSPSAMEKAGQAILRQKLTDLTLKETTATVKIFGNPLIRHGNLVNIAGNMPKNYSGTWYVQSVEHDITPNNYFTTLKLMAASPENPFFRSDIKKFQQKINKTQQKKPNKLGRIIPDVAKGR